MKNFQKYTNLAAAISFCCLFLVALDASADTIRKTVKGNKFVVIASHAAWSGKCSHRSISVKLVSRPKHGKMKTGRGKVTISRARVGKLSDCEGKVVSGKTILYKPTKGFKGKDSFKYKVKVPKGSFSNSVIITVK